MNSPFRTVKFLDANPIPTHPWLTVAVARAEMELTTALEDAPELFLRDFPFIPAFEAALNAACEDLGRTWADPSLVERYLSP